MSHPAPEQANSDGEDGASRCICTGSQHAAVVPRVIRTAAASDAASTMRTPGYSPRMSVDMAGVHSWAPYTAVIPTLRSLSLTSISDVFDRDVAKNAVAGLYSRAPPFGAARRFPAGEVYVCLDRAPLVSVMMDIQKNIMMAEAAEPCSEEHLAACSGYMWAVRSATAAINGVEEDDRRGAPVLYDRAVFESAFLLTWTEP